MPDLQQQIAELQRELDFARQREEFLARIDALTRTAVDPTEVTSGVAQLLGRHLRVNRCVLAEIQDDENTFIITGSYVNGLDPLPTTFTISDFSEPLQQLLQSGGVYIVEDTETDPLSADSLEVYRATGLRSTISIPLMKEGKLRGALAVHCNQPRRWTPHEISLMTATTARCWETTERLRILRDLQSERKELHNKTMELERQHAELETIYRTAPIGLALFDLDGYHYLRLNDRQAAFFGLKPEDILGKTLTQMAPIEGLRELFDQVAAGTPVINYPLEGHLVTDPDTYRYWTVSYFPVYGPDGTIQGITAASLEITPQKKAEIALLQSEKLAAVGRLASSIAHEINNPLEAVTNLLYLAEHSETLDEARGFILTAEVELHRASAITTQTLKFHKQASSPQEVDMQQLMDSVLAIYQGRIVNSRITVEVSWTTHRPVKCFEGEIRQVLSNLTSNALDSMHDGGRLIVRGREGTDWKTHQRGVFVAIADTGEGMSAETQRKLFDAFYTTKGMTGTGLGLWVSQEIVARHQGTLNVRSSQKPGSRGTVFTLFLPFLALAEIPDAPRI